MPDYSTQKIRQLASLLRFGLLGGPQPTLLPLSEAEWQSLFDLSRRQAVTALAYDAILALPKEQRPPRRVLFHFATMAQTIESDNRRREAALLHFAELMHSRLSLPTVVVKGSSLARFYPCPLHRECGDNDLLTGGDTERVGAEVEQLGIAVDRKDPRHIAFAFENTTFECHTYLLYHNDDPQWDTGSEFKIANTREEGLALHTLCAEEAAFFLAKHCEHHAVFFHNPVRLRSLLDWCLLLGSDGFDLDKFNGLKRGTDVEVFADLMTSYCCDLLGLDSNVAVPQGLAVSDFEHLYLECPERHRSALVRVARRSGKYLRYRRQYKAVYGQSMFGRFYLDNLRIALRQKIKR